MEELCAYMIHVSNQNVQRSLWKVISRRLLPVGLCYAPALQRLFV